MGQNNSKLFMQYDFQNYLISNFISYYNPKSIMFYFPNVLLLPQARRCKPTNIIKQFL